MIRIAFVVDSNGQAHLVAVGPDGIGAIGPDLWQSCFVAEWRWEYVLGLLPHGYC